jgi:CHAT domain-containing protein
VEALGNGGVLKLGPEASERFLKSSDLRPWGFLHFATHAIADDTEPNRSALVLAAGDASEDGLLQPREIAALDLGGKVVLLSACRTASGELLQGENALGLVRSFFHAGARAVLASPWPLVDSEARALIDELSSRLRRGQTLDAALAGAKRARRLAGDPTMAWAGLQLYGEGSSALAEPPSDPRVALFLVAASIVTVLTGVLATLARRRALRARERNG